MQHSSSILDYLGEVIQISHVIESFSFCKDMRMENHPLMIIINLLHSICMPIRGNLPMVNSGLIVLIFYDHFYDHFWKDHYEQRSMINDQFSSDQYPLNDKYQTIDIKYFISRQRFFNK